MKKRKKILLLVALKRKYEKQREADKEAKRFWVRKIFEERKIKGEFNLVIKDLKLFGHEYIFKYFRMTPKTFEELLALVTPLIIKECKTGEPNMS